MFSSLGSILMLHRTAPYNASGFRHNENLKLSPEELEVVILQLKKQKRKFVSLDEAGAIINSKKRYTQKFIVFTLDDGYKDNLYEGYPVFAHHRVPLCIYITNSFPNNTSNLWWFALENLVLTNDTITNPNGKLLMNHTKGLKEKNFLLIRSSILKDNFRDPIDYIKSMGNLSFRLAKERIQKCLSWEEVSVLANKPLVTIGAHTMNHFPLARLSDEEVHYEIAESKLELERQLKIQINHFAYPFGSVNEVGEREFAIAKEIGFHSIVTTQHGHVYKNADRNKLDRIFLHPLRPNHKTLNQVLFFNVKTLISMIRESVTLR